MKSLQRDHERLKSNILHDKEMIGPWLLKESIAVGTTGTVKLSQHVYSGAKAAVKCVDKTIARKRKEAKNEIRCLHSVDHDHVIKLEHVQEDPNFIYIFTEYYETGDLYEYVQRHGPMSEMTARMLFHQMVDAIEFCHSRLNIVHHDVKAENFVLRALPAGFSSSSLGSPLDYAAPAGVLAGSAANSLAGPAGGFGALSEPLELHLKLIDFGFAVPLDPTGQKSIRVFDSSPAYSPLELLLRRPHDESVDLYALGVCLYFMLCRTFPFCSEKTTHDQLVKNVQAGVIEFPKELKLSTAVKHLLSRLLAKVNRYTIDDVKGSPWFLGHSHLLQDDDPYL
eukprot:TRINITY_DN4185_c0_g1_i1.p1 TRINITY_DN4185_c0_g1~~TRINITY_DN4185_c0_g1_i1.p1  ORF type:complete len:338 (+),score=52.27 TRINITY_DN4185_c0_g1_i1:236-1249(+)